MCTHNQVKDFITRWQCKIQTSMVCLVFWKSMLRNDPNEISWIKACQSCKTVNISVARFYDLFQWYNMISCINIFLMMAEKLTQAFRT